MPSITKECPTTLTTFETLDYHMNRRTFLTCAWVSMGLNGSTCSECLPVVTCKFEPPEHVPRTTARAHTCAVMFGRAPFVLRSREHEKCAKKTFIPSYDSCYITPRCETPGNRFIHSRRKQNFENPPHKLVLGSSSNLDDRFRTAFLCRRSCWVLC